MPEEIKEKHNFTRDELIREIEEGTEIGKKIIEVEMTYLKALADGSLLKEINNPRNK